MDLDRPIVITIRELLTACGQSLAAGFVLGFIACYCIAAVHHNHHHRRHR